MSTEADRRVRAAVRAALDELPVAQPSAAAVRYRARAVRQPRRTAWMAPALAAATVLALVMVVGVVPGRLLQVPPEPAGAASMVLPPMVDAPGRLTASAGEAPAGAAVAAYRYEDRLVLVGGDGRSYRTITAGEVAAWGEPGRPIGEVRLSPDGTRLAGAAGLVVDLVSGEARRVGVPPSVDRPLWQGLSNHRVLAWSPDGNRLAYRLAAQEIGQITGKEESGEGVAIVNVRTSVTQYLATSLSELSVAFSPDGGRVAVTGVYGSQQRCLLQLYAVDGELLSQRSLAEGFRLAGEGTSWSPDGRWLAVQRGSYLSSSEWGGSDGFNRLGLISPDGDAETVVLTVSASPWELLGWRSATSLVVAGDDSPGRARIYELPVNGGPSRHLSTLPEGVTAAPGGIQLASGMLAGLEVRPAGRADHGPLPADWRAAILAGVGVVLAVAVGFGRRIGSRRSRP